MSFIKKAAAGVLCSCLWITASHAEDYKIGTLNILKVIQQSPQTEVSAKNIDKEFAKREQKILEAQKKLKEQEDKLDKDRAVMNDTQLRSLEREIINMRRELKRDQDEFREDLTFRRNEELAKIQKLVIGSIKEVAKENKYDIILSEGVIYSSSKVDISNMVIDYLKAQHTAEKQSSAN